MRQVHPFCTWYGARLLTIVCQLARNPASRPSCWPTWIVSGKSSRTAARSVMALRTSQYVSWAFELAMYHRPVALS
ncbi:hypothetical protein NKG94_15310 [Micromonospora sp. M12]